MWKKKSCSHLVGFDCGQHFEHHFLVDATILGHIFHATLVAVVAAAFKIVFLKLYSYKICESTACILLFSHFKPCFRNPARIRPQWSQ